MDKPRHDNEAQGRPVQGVATQPTITGGFRRAGRAFTLTELLVVMAVIAIAIAIIVPLVNASRLSRPQAGIQAVSVATETARRFAGRDRDPYEIDFGPPYGERTVPYTGTAIIFTPSHDIRLVETDPFAALPNGTPMVDFSPPLFGYRDIRNRDYIQLPRGSGVVGILRVGTDPADGIVLIAPPFAVRFDQHGRLVPAHDFLGDPTSSERSRLVFYASNYDTGGYNVTAGRPGGYDPAPYDPHHLDFNTNNAPRDPHNKYAMPFDRLESVLGVIVFDKDAFYDEFGRDGLAAGGNGFLPNAVRDWLIENGDSLFINRHTGRLMKND